MALPFILGAMGVAAVAKMASSKCRRCDTTFWTSGCKVNGDDYCEACCSSQRNCRNCGSSYISRGQDSQFCQNCIDRGIKWN